MRENIMKILRIIFLFALLACQPLVSQISTPGRLGTDSISYAKFGDCEIYFYMNEEKAVLSKELPRRVNEDMMITLGTAALPCPTREIMVQAIKSPEKDPIGTSLLKDYAENVHAIARNYLGLNLLGLSWYMNLNLNWEALKIHHDQFVQQYRFMQENQLSSSDYTLVQDLTLIDWQMGKGTVAGTMVQDGRMGDRYIIYLFPDEVVGTFYTEPAYSFSNESISRYPGHITMPPHSTIAPMDYQSGNFCGSSKGKRISTAVRGIVANDQMAQLRSASQKLEINRRIPEVFPNGSGAVYSNGISIRPLSDKAPKIVANQALLIGENENVTIASISIDDNAFLVEHIRNVFNIPATHRNASISRLIKKDSGFTSLKKLELPLQDNSKIVLLNSSILPDGYRYFNIAQDGSQTGLPWIQLYHIEPGLGMEVPADVFMALSLSPLEELIYRNEDNDAINSEYSELMKKFTTQIDCIIFND